MANKSRTKDDVDEDIGIDEEDDLEPSAKKPTLWQQLMFRDSPPWAAALSAMQGYSLGKSVGVNGKVVLSDIFSIALASSLVIVAKPGAKLPVLSAAGLGTVLGIFIGKQTPPGTPSVFFGTPTDRVIMLAAAALGAYGASLATATKEVHVHPGTPTIFGRD